MNMDSNAVTLSGTRRRARSSYERFTSSEGVPIISGFDVNQISAIPLAPWRRLGCDGAYLNFFGSDGVIGMYAGRLAPGASTLPERHLYEKIIYFIEGSGTAEVQQRDRVPQSLCWQPGSLFSPPLNALHRLMNYSDRPALFLAVTTAPLALDHYRNERFIFNSEFIFSERYDGQADYFAPADGGYSGRDRRQWVHHGNFIADVHDVRRYDVDGSTRRVKITRFEMANNSLIAQLVQWPMGRYRKAHCGSGGVLLAILRSSGYSLMWPSRLGTQPYENGLADQVVRIDWRPGSVLSPPPNWFHQHFNTGKEPALTLAFHCGSALYPMSRRADGAGAPRQTVKGQSGALLPFDGDDPSIRRMYEAELAEKGITAEMRRHSAGSLD
jgi:oxalate decarboxylase/phosphoglucose isomerase-like protein (cupin superfamily)